MIIPISPGQWMHVESGMIISDDGVATLTIQRPSDAVPRSIPVPLIATVRGALGHLPAPPPPQIKQKDADAVGIQLWKATREGM